MCDNMFAVRPLSGDDKRLLLDLLNASASLWKELHHRCCVFGDG